MICGTELEHKSNTLPTIISGLKRLACFVAKRVNETCLVLSALAIDIDSMQHAVDFLLLTHGHSCEEFDGM